MIGEAEFAAMKPEAVVINVGRGPVIDESRDGEGAYRSDASKARAWMSSTRSPCRMASALSAE